LKRIILLVGVPASGKSTLARKLVERGYQSICADTIRAELYGNEIEQGDPMKVFEIFFERLEKLLLGGLDVVVDNTNLKVPYRKEITDRAQKFGYEDIQFWVLDVPLDVCIARNSARERKIENDILTNMYHQFDRNGRPKRSEGKIVLVRPGKDENDFRFFASN
jgi:predicted kinase